MNQIILTITVLVLAITSVFGGLTNINQNKRIDQLQHEVVQLMGKSK